MSPPWGARATTTIASLDSSAEMYVFAPSTRTPPSTGVAVVRRLFAFDPAPGSVNAKQKRVVPAAIPGSQRSRCSSVPCRAIIVPAIAVEITSFAAG